MKGSLERRTEQPGGGGCPPPGGRRRPRRGGGQRAGPSVPQFARGGAGGGTAEVGDPASPLPQGEPQPDPRCWEQRVTPSPWEGAGGCHRASPQPWVPSRPPPRYCTTNGRLSPGGVGVGGDRAGRGSRGGAGGCGGEGAAAPVLAGRHRIAAKPRGGAGRRRGRRRGGRDPAAGELPLCPALPKPPRPSARPRSLEGDTHTHLGSSGGISG